jgi:tetratricopeptide (TPR) repeat protein
MSNSDSADPSDDVTLVGDEGAGKSSAIRRREAGLTRGEVVGRYVVIDRVGAGGMGVVYAAYDPELDRRVALKLLLAESGPGSNSENSDGPRRLLREAQAMAKIVHPNVITVYDTGTHDGSVFVAMEFVEGQSLGRWIESERDWKRVVDVFIDAGNGLAAAHAAGLVHRDFKPDNVMLGDDGRVRVMDFGLARKVEIEDGDALPAAEDLVTMSSSQALDAMTRTGALLGTPAYMAPEQYAGGTVSEASDQFAFCVALWESVYRQRPFRGETLAALAFQVSQGEIQPPPADAKAPKALRRILERGLSQRASDRWPSMQALVHELEVSRRPRRWPVLAVAGAAALAIVAYVAGGTGGPDVCRGAEEQLAGVWDEARASEVERGFSATGLEYAAETNERIRPVLDDLAAKWTAGWKDACEAANVRLEQSPAMLDARMVCLDESRSMLKSTVALLTDADEDVARNAWRMVAAIPDPARCSDLEYVQAAVKPPSDPALAERVAGERERLAEVKALQKAGKYEESVALARETLTAARELGYDPLVARASLLLAGSLQFDGQYAEARAPAEEAYELARKVGDHEHAAESAGLLTGLVGDRLRKYEEGLIWGRITGVEAGIAKDARVDAHRVANEGVILLRMGDAEAAVEHLERALEMFRAVDGERSPALGDALDNLGNALQTVGRHEDAEKSHRASLAMREVIFGKNHPNLVPPLTNLANVLESEQRPDEALQVHRRALEIARASLGDDHPHTAAVEGNLGKTLYFSGKPEEALGHLARASEIAKRVLGPGHADTKLLTGNYIAVLAAQERWEEAYAESKVMAQARAKEVEATSPDYHLVWSEHADMACHAHHTDEGIQLLRELMGREMDEGPRKLRVESERAAALAGCHLLAGQPTDALEWANKSVEIAEESGDRFRLGQSLLGLADAQWTSGQKKAALATIERARESYSKSENPEYVSQADEWLSAHGQSGASSHGE